MDDALHEANQAARPAYKAIAHKIGIMFAVQISEEDVRKRWDHIKGDLEPHEKTRVNKPHE